MSFITNLNQQQRKRLHQITLVATFGGLLFGYDTGVINGAFSSLKQYMALTPTTEGLVMSVLLVGAALGSVFGGKFADYFGQQQIASFIASSFQRSKIVSAVPGRYDNSQRDDDLPDRLAETGDAAYATR
jgi:MFS transporter, SP family, major inositol transporter